MTISEASQASQASQARAQREAGAKPAVGMSAMSDILDLDMSDTSDTTSELDLAELRRALEPVIEPYPRTPRQARSLRTREALLKAAEEQFIAKGYAGVTADEIAAAAGVSVGAFYNYYRNKRQILMALAQRRLGDIF